MEDIGPVHFRMRRPGPNKGETHLVVADVVLDGATVFVTLSRKTGLWPFVIENNSAYEVCFGQKVWNCQIFSVQILMIYCRMIRMINLKLCTACRPTQRRRMLGITLQLEIGNYT